MILYALIFGYVAYIGVVLLQGSWYKNRNLTESRFVLPQVAFWSSFSLLVLVAASSTLQGVLIGVTVSVICWIIGYPLAKWVYRKLIRFE
jgi:uncharacterized membrane protein